MIEYTRQQVITRLTAEISTNLAQVEAMPDNLESWQMTHALAALLVQYPGSTYAISGAGQLKRKIVVDVYVLTRRLAGGRGADHYIDLVTEKLYLYKPGDGFGRMRPVRDRLVAVNEVKGWWQYVVTFEVSAPYYGQTLIPAEEPNA